MENPRAYNLEAKEKILGKTSTFNKHQTSFKTIILSVVIVLALISMVLGAVNVGLFLTNVRFYPLSSPPSWLNNPNTKEYHFYVWSASGVYTFVAIIEAVLGLLIKDAKEKIALAFIIFGPVPVVISLLQTAAGALMFSAYYSSYSSNLLDSQFLISLMDIAVAVAGLLIAIWILVMWFLVISKRSKKKPEIKKIKPKKAKKEEAEDTESEDETPQQPQAVFTPMDPRMMGYGGLMRPPPSFFPGPPPAFFPRPPPAFFPRPPPAFFPRPLPTSGFPMSLVANPRLRIPPQPFPNFGPFSQPIRRPLMPTMPYQPYGRMPINYRPRFF